MIVSHAPQTGAGAPSASCRNVTDRDAHGRQHTEGAPGRIQRLRERKHFPRGLQVARCGPRLGTHRLSRGAGAGATATGSGRRADRVRYSWTERMVPGVAGPARVQPVPGFRSNVTGRRARVRAGGGSGTTAAHARAGTEPRGWAPVKAQFRARQVRLAASSPRRAKFGHVPGPELRLSASPAGQKPGRAPALPGPARVRTPARAPGRRPAGTHRRPGPDSRTSPPGPACPEAAPGRHAPTRRAQARAPAPRYMAARARTRTRRDRARRDRARQTPNSGQEPRPAAPRPGTHPLGHATGARGPPGRARTRGQRPRPVGARPAGTH